MTDTDYMHEALAEARLAAEAGEMPVGCVIVRDGAIIARAHNECEALGDATAHAELLAIRRASAACGDWRLNRCTLYVTLEPCPMCAGAFINARLGTLVYGAREAQYGSAASVLNLFEERYPSHTAIFGGILAEESAALLKAFFEKMRD